jgi:hypothetical protein
MDSETRLKALARLAQSHTDAAKAALQKEVDLVAQDLETQRDYDILTQNLAALDVFGYRFSTRTIEIVESFIRSIEGRELVYSEHERAVSRDVSAYKNSATLLIQAIEVVSGLRYLETVSVLRILLGLAKHKSDKVRKKAFEALEALAAYNIDVFYGQDRKGGIGATPQMMIVEELERLQLSELKANFATTLILLAALLSPTMEATSWSYKSVTISRGATPAAPAVSEIRRRSIELLKRLYGMAATLGERLSIVNALHDATRSHDLDVTDATVSAMISRDSAEVLSFYEQLVRTEDLQVVQKIESHSYWIYHHAHRDDIRAAALAVERAIAKHAEYQIYRTLVGFEGIFGAWGELKKSGRDFSATDETRRRTATEYAASITRDNYQEWRERILRFAKTESDDLATFPIFYFFLETFAKAQPELALSLVRADTDAIERFLIPLLRGLWTGPEQAAVRSLIESWIDQADTNGGRHLFASTKLFLSTETLDIELLKRLLAKAAALKDLATVRQVISVAIANYRDGNDLVLNALFLPALEVLTREKDATWIFDAWFRREVREVLARLDEKSVNLVLQNLRGLARIDYHAEEVLRVIAERKPEAVLAFLCDRIDLERARRATGSREFEAIPFEFHKLQEPLSRVPKLAVRRVRDLFTTDSKMFAFRGARLLRNIFPRFPPDFEAELLELIREGGEQNYRFVLGILRNYKGELFLHHVCKELVKVLPADSPLLSEVAIALETTGVVSGDFGMAEAYERKRLEVLEWLTDPDERVRDFARSYVNDLEHMRDDERKRAEEDIALQKFRYGEPDPQ